MIDTCKCGELRGRVFEGEICPKCETKVEFKDTDLEITGWIILHNHKIIHPIFYKKLQSIIGKQFPEMIKFDKKVSRDGQLVSKDPKQPYKGIGLIEFYERFDEILEFYKNKRKRDKNKMDLIEEIEEERDKVFTSCIPVYSSVLRPLAYRGDSFFFSSIDKKYNSLFSSARLLNDSDKFESARKRKERKGERMDVPTILSSCQEKLMTLWDLVFEQIDSKHGQIKSDILGGMLNWSSRTVIVPDPSLRVDQVKLPYQAFLELYKYQIIAYLSKMNDVSESKAYEEWFYARISYSSKVYELMKLIIKKHKPRIILNRNPKLNWALV